VRGHRAVDVLGACSVSGNPENVTRLGICIA
jgi:hypothetical protein